MEVEEIWGLGNDENSFFLGFVFWVLRILINFFLGCTFLPILWISNGCMFDQLVREVYKTLLLDYLSLILVYRFWSHASGNLLG